MTDLRWRHARDGTLKHGVQDEDRAALCGFAPSKGWVPIPMHGGGDLRRRERCPRCENERARLGLPRG